MCDLGPRMDERQSATSHAMAILAWLGVCFALPVALSADNDLAGVDSDGSQLLAEVGVEGGLVVHLGCGDGEFTASLFVDDRFLVHGLGVDMTAIQLARSVIQESGCYGKVSVTEFDGQHLPYADNLVNAIVLSDAFAVSREEMMRVLTPGGVLIHPATTASRRETSVKPWPAEMGDWSHHVHGPDGNPVTPDTLVGPPERIQWLVGPKWQRAHDTDANINALVTAGGRVFYMVDEAPIGLPGANGLPDQWSLVGRDAFNGKSLWRVRVKKWGWREYKDTHYRTRHDVIPINVHRRVVATAEHVYATLGIGAPVSQLNAATGVVQQVYCETEGTREILVQDDQLLVTVPGGEKLHLLAIDAATGDLAWKSSDDFAGTAKETGRLPIPKVPVLNVAADSELACVMDGDQIVGLDRQTGKTRWRSSPESKGPELWAGTLILHDGVVLYAEQGLLTALSAKDGSRLWVRQERLPGGLWFSWKDIFVIDGVVWTWGPLTRGPLTELQGLDLQTGQLKRRVPLGNIFRVDHHHRCYRNKATSNYVIASRRGAEFISLAGDSLSVNNWVRGICHLGMMPANGMLYAPPEPCKCYWYERVSDFCALAPASLRAAEPEEEPQRVSGPAQGRSAGPSAGADDWPAFRGDSARSGATRAELPQHLKLVWSAKLSGRLSSPIAVDDRLYVAAVDAHTVYAIDAATGRLGWQYTAGGRVDSPPTYAEGKLVFGTRDGWVICLRASDGETVWRFHAAPHSRLIGAYDQLESAWPVHGSVLIRDRVVYFAAGRSSYLDGGIRLFGLDLDSGEVRYQTRIEGPAVNLEDENWFEGYNDSGGRGALSDILQSVGDAICMRNRSFDSQLVAKDGPAAVHLQPMGGFLDDTYFKRYYWFYGLPMDRTIYAAMAKPQINEEQMRIALGQLLVQDDEAIYGMRMFDSMKLLNADNYFVPGKDGYLLFKVAPGVGRPAWTQRVPVRVNAMAATAKQLVIAGPPDIVDPDDPLGAFQGREGGCLRLLSKATGKTVQEMAFDSPTVFHGVAIAEGRVFLTHQDGSLHCLGAP